MTLTVGTYDFTRDFVDAQLLVVPGIRMEVIRPRCPNVKEFMFEGLKI